MGDVETFVEDVKQTLSIEKTVHLRVKVTPGAPEMKLSEVLKGEEPILKMKVTAPAEKGRANQAVENFLGDIFHCRAKIVSGHTTGLKLIQLQT